MTDAPPLETLKYWVNRFLNRGDMETWNSAEASCKWLHARYPEEATGEAEYVERMRVAQLCDLEHLLTTAMSLEERSDTKDYVERCRILLSWLVEAGAAQPARRICDHGKSL